jgi:hypothetical protein
MFLLDLEFGPAGMEVNAGGEVQPSFSREVPFSM